MEFNQEVFDKINKLQEYKRKHDPLLSMFDEIYYEMFPVKQVQKIFQLGGLSVWAFIKSELFKYMEESDKEMFEMIFTELNKNDEIKEMLAKLITNKEDFNF